MNGHHKKSPILGNPVDSDDVKYVSGLSTILVATIQEVKDRISQIEYIFCSQLYPNIQSKYKNSQKIYSEAKEAAEVAWKEKVHDFILQIEKLQLEKKQALEEKQSLNLEKEKQMEEHEENTKEQFAKVRSQEHKIHELESKMILKCKEVDEGMALQNKLLVLVQEKTSEIVNIGAQLKANEEKTKVLMADLNKLEKKVEMLQEELKQKTREVANGKEWIENLREQIKLQALDKEQMLIGFDKERKLLTTKLEWLNENVGGRHEELRKKTKLEDVRKLQERLHGQIDLNDSEMVKKEQQLVEFDNERGFLLTKVRALEEKVNELQVKLRESSSEADGDKDSYRMLAQQIESKASELMAERRKYRELFDRYKRLKSQYNYLLIKTGFTAENMISLHKLESESESKSDSLRHHQIQKPLSDHESEIPDASAAFSEARKVKNEIVSDDSLEDGKGVKSIQTSSSPSPTSSFPIMPKCSLGEKSALVSGRKRPASGWRETRSLQCKDGPDPHDDFLDTPLENKRGNLSKVIEEEADGRPAPAPEGISVDSSDDETQDINVDYMPKKQQIAVQMADKRGFKYVESVRKKAERENLRGFECNQCKKFYDAVLDNGSRDNSGNKQDFRCEHHDGVSRHRYRYNPPLTPEGFWNIGFESEM